MLLFVEYIVSLFGISLKHIRDKSVWLSVYSAETLDSSCKNAFENEKKKTKCTHLKSFIEELYSKFGHAADKSPWQID